MGDNFLEQLEKKNTHFSWGRVWVIIFALILIAIFLFVGIVVDAKNYSDKAVPGLHISGVSVGGMNRAELEEFLQSMNNKMLDDGLNFYFQSGGEKKKIFLSPVIVNEGTAIEMMYIDIKKEAGRLINYGKKEGFFENAVSVEKSRFIKPSVKLENVVLDYDKMVTALEERISEYEKAPADANVVISSVSPLNYEITKSSPGVVFQYGDAVKEAQSLWSKLQVSDIEINQRNSDAIIKEENVRSIISRLPVVFSAGNITLSYKDPQTKRNSEWYVGVDKISDWLSVQKKSEQEYVFGLDKKKVMNYLKTEVAPKVEVEARDAKFSMDENNKVKEFQGSRPGIKLDLESTYALLNDAVIERTKHDEGVAKDVSLSIIKTEPNVTTADANDLGIKEVLGIGVSYYTGSPANRIKNIKNALKKLNGILIKPDEEFSALKYTQPFTLEGGYLPELVIKGDEVKPEIGGGLCQIGTTLFRMAMNSGMPITQRRNHSLVVSYYNDLANGLPGTDATIYDPAPDFRFKNDTGNYILIQTDIDEKTGKLEFTLWGTSDGRKGWYDPPVLEKWIGHGETRYIETEKLAPGQKTCQHAYRGAKASFKYTRELSDGEKQEEVFESYYRPLPEICLIGVEKKQSCFDENGAEILNCNINPTPEAGAEAPIIAE